jgi:prepilin signal peptidase PulO-like enzyme (type II secretory pathway)
MEILTGIVFFILGLCFGSFVNMLIYRTASKYKILKIKRADTSVRPYNESRSYCDYCGKQLSWYENVPVFSWLFLKGKTKCCSKKLPLSYPIVELSMGILFLISVFIGRPQESSLQFGLGLLIIVLLVFSAVFDWKYMILPDFSTIILIIISFLNLLINKENIIIYLLSALISAGFLWFLNLITKGKGMGMGDVKLALFMGLFLGYPKIIVAFYGAFITGAIYGISLMFFKKAGKKSQIAFGPFLILGTLMSWWWGEKIIELIIR